MKKLNVCYSFKNFQNWNYSLSKMASSSSTLYIINEVELSLHSPSEYTIAVNFDSANEPLDGFVTYIVPEDKLPNEIKKQVDALNLEECEEKLVYANEDTLKSICELFKEYVELKEVYKDAENNPDAYEMSPNVMSDHLDALNNLIDKCLEDSYLSCDKLYRKFGKDSDDEDDDEEEEEEEEEEESDEDMEEEKEKEEKKKQKDDTDSDADIIKYLRKNLKDRLNTSAVIDKMISCTEVNNTYQKKNINSVKVVILQLVRYNIRECE